MRGPSWVWGLPLVPWTLPEAADAVMDLVAAGRPSYFITANTHHAMLTRQDPRLRAVNEQAAFLVADGAPLVWASRGRKDSLPERVAGSDLIFDLCERAARRGYSLFFLGGAEGVAAEAARRLSRRYPGLRIAGAFSPPFRDLSRAEHDHLIGRIRAAQPDILCVAFGSPKGELWLSQHYETLGVPVSVQVGATLDFVAGRVRRAPRWLQRLGLEWAHRMWLEPARLFPRYARNAAFILRMMHESAWRGILGRVPAPLASATEHPSSRVSGDAGLTITGAGFTRESSRP
jgi:N-acetylglucosaminyldiphosphoundecaprenol N-acetyl-beta-D-mannosaminyltransferase